MTITLGALSTGSALHGTVKASAWEYTRTVQTFFAVTGEVHLQGRLHGRDLTAWVLPKGYATHALLHDDIESFNNYIGLYDSLVWTVGADSKTFTNVVFNGMEPEEDPWQDGSGVNGFQQLCILKFRQIKA